MKFLHPSTTPKVVAMSLARQLIPRVLIADSFFARMRGWYGYQRSFNTRRGIDAVLLTATSSVHTIGMSFRLDLLWLDPELRCIAVSRGVRPWRARWCRGASHVLELPSNSHNRLLHKACQPGRKLRLVEKPVFNPGKEA